MGHVGCIESAILQEVNQLSPCTLEQLVHRLPEYSWSEVFSAVDRCSRDGTLTLRHPARFGIVIFATPRRPGEKRAALVGKWEPRAV